MRLLRSKLLARIQAMSELSKGQGREVGLGQEIGQGQEIDQGHEVEVLIWEDCGEDPPMAEPWYVVLFVLIITDGQRTNFDKRSPFMSCCYWELSDPFMLQVIISHCDTSGDSQCFSMAGQPPTIAHHSRGIIHGSLGPPESACQTASRSVQPFLLTLLCSLVVITTTELLCDFWFTTSQNIVIVS